MQRDSERLLASAGAAESNDARTVADLDTPALLVDIDRLERNLERWQRYCDQHELRCRPHVKTHKCVEIARRQVELGAVGVVCQKLGEAEVMIEAGIGDVLIPFNLVGDGKLSRLRALCSKASVSVAVDNEFVLAGLSRTVASSNSELGVVVECDTGHGRAGVQSPEAAATLAAAAARLPGLRFEGFLTHPAPAGCAAFLATAVERAERKGLHARTVSAGGTPKMWRAHELCPPVTEYRAGNYVFLDRLSVAAGAGAAEDVALTVLTTVSSRPTTGRAIIDAGSKSLSSDRGPDDGFGAVLEHPGCRVFALDEEHGYIEGTELDALEVGRRIRVIPNHACPVTNLFDRMALVSGDRVLGTWAVAARGRSA